MHEMADVDVIDFGFISIKGSGSESCTSWPLTEKSNFFQLAQSAQSAQFYFLNFKFNILT